MGFLEIYSIIMLISITGLFIFTLSKIIRKSRYIRNIGNKIRLKNKQFYTNYIWIIFIAVNLLNISKLSNNTSMGISDVYIEICYIIALIYLLSDAFSTDIHIYLKVTSSALISQKSY